MPALDIVNDVLLDGMKVVGELFGSGQMQLPFVLQSAETMKTAVAYLEPHMDRVDGSTSKGKLVIATVKGDVHDIGKNLVDIIATNNGYEVHNLGIKVPIGEMVAKVKEVDADALGMSGLLVKSTLIMRDNLEELNSLGLSEIPVLLGGAALTRRYVERDLREIYQGRLFYGRDAFEGLSTLDSLMTMKRSGDWDPDFGTCRRAASCPSAPATAMRQPSSLPSRSPSVAIDNEVFAPPFLGSRVVKGISLDEIAGVRQRDGAVPQPVAVPTRAGPGDDGAERPENDDEFKRRIRATFREQLAAAKASGVLVPQLVYGYFPANGDGDDLVVWTDESRTTEAARFHFPRQQVEPFLCIADFFRPVASGEIDYAAFHIVTMGAAVSEETARLFAADEYQRYLLLHGLGVEMAEALAEYWHRRIREEWGFVGEDGPIARRAVPPAVPRRPLLVGLSGLPRPRGQRHGRPTCSAPSVSASPSARRPAGSTSPSRRRRRSSATTRRRSTSSPADRRPALSPADGSPTRPWNTTAVEAKSRMAKKNGWSTSITTGSGVESGGIAITSPTTTAVAAAASVPASSTVMSRLVDDGRHHSGISVVMFVKSARRCRRTPGSRPSADQRIDEVERRRRSPSAVAPARRRSRSSRGRRRRGCRRRRDRPRSRRADPRVAGRRSARSRWCRAARSAACRRARRSGR